MRKWFFTSASIKLIGNKKTNATVGFFIILTCMGLVPVYIYIYAPCVYSAYRGRKRATNSLGMKLQVVVNLCVGARIQNWVLQKNSKNFQLSRPLPFLVDHCMRTFREDSSMCD